MIWKKENFIIEGINCMGYPCNEPKYLLIQPVDENDMEVLDKQIEIVSNQVKEAFLMIAFQVKDWNKKLSPWNMPAVLGKEDFGDGAKETLFFLEKVLLTSVHKKYKLDENIKTILGGYSLAGLFSLWSAYQTKRFDAIVAASPSVWFQNWIEYASEHKPLTDIIYLSLGDKEEKTKNKVMRTVGEAIRTQEDILKKQEIETTLEWNEGGHFQNSEIRLARGFCWCINALRDDK